MCFFSQFYSHRGSGSGLAVSWSFCWRLNARQRFISTLPYILSRRAATRKHKLQMTCCAALGGLALAEPMCGWSIKKMFVCVSDTCCSALESSYCGGFVVDFTIIWPEWVIVSDDEEFLGLFLDLLPFNFCFCGPTNGPVATTWERLIGRKCFPFAASIGPFV